jgi:hypothetical protein
MERVTGFKPVVSTLGKLHVITTPYPHNLLTQWIISDTKLLVKHFLASSSFFLSLFEPSALYNTILASDAAQYPHMQLEQHLHATQPRSHRAR